MGANIHANLQNFHWSNSEDHFDDSIEAAAIDIFSLRGYSYPISYCHTCLPFFQRDSEKVPVGHANPFGYCSYVFLLFLARKNRVRQQRWSKRPYSNVGVFCGCIKHTDSLCRMHYSNEKHEQIPQYRYKLVSKLVFNRDMYGCITTDERELCGVQKSYLVILGPLNFH